MEKSGCGNIKHNHFYHFIAVPPSGEVAPIKTLSVFARLSNVTAEVA